MIDVREAAKEGKRMHAFYLGAMAARRGHGANPFPPGSEQAKHWANAWRYTAQEEADGTARI